MRLWILSASTGGGHDMRAHALKDWWEDAGGAASVFHPMEASFFGYRFGCSLYNIIQKTLPALHYGYFHFLELAGLHRGRRRIIGSDRVISEFRNFSPHLVVSMHAHLNHGYFDLLKKEAGRNLRFCVYSGELSDGEGFSRHWINPKNDLFAGPTSECCQAAQLRGMPEEKCIVAGPLLRKAFFLPDANFCRAEVFAKYKLSESLPTFLLCTGANGVNNHLEVIASFAASSMACQIIALCGPNHGLRHALLKHPINHKVKVVALETIDDLEMVKLMKVADWAFARPGAGITTEAMATGCPLIFDLTGGIMPQETNNLNYWKIHARSLVTCSRPSSLPAIAQSVAEIPNLKMPSCMNPEKFVSILKNLCR